MNDIRFVENKEMIIMGRLIFCLSVHQNKKLISELIK